MLAVYVHSRYGTCACATVCMYMHYTNSSPRTNSIVGNWKFMVRTCSCADTIFNYKALSGDLDIVFVNVTYAIHNSSVCIMLIAYFF